MLEYGTREKWGAVILLADFLSAVSVLCSFYFNQPRPGQPLCSKQSARHRGHQGSSFSLWLRSPFQRQAGKQLTPPSILRLWQRGPQAARGAPGGLGVSTEEDFLQEEVSKIGFGGWIGVFQAKKRGKKYQECSETWRQKTTGIKTVSAEGHREGGAL